MVTKMSSKNMLNARLNGGDFKELVGKKVTVSEIDTFKKAVTDKETGESVERDIVCIATKDNKVYGSPSPTLTECLLAIRDYAVAEELDTIDVLVEYKKSNSGRQFLSASLS